MRICMINASETLMIRQKVLWPDLLLENCTLSDDEHGIHIGAFDNDTLIAVASVFENNNEYRLRKFAVMHEKQGQGVGSEILQFISKMLIDMNAKTLWFDARCTAIPFYKKFGFVQTGDTFYKRDVLYVKMQRALTFSP